MKSRLIVSSVVVALGMVVSALWAPAGVWAQTADLTEPEQTENLLEKYPYRLDRDKDPFRPLVRPPQRQILVPPPTPVPVDDKVTEPPPRPVPPLKIKVLGIVGNEGGRLTMVRWENSIKILRENDTIPGEFTVMAIAPEEVTVFSVRENIRRTFRLSYGE